MKVSEAYKEHKKKHGTKSVSQGSFYSRIRDHGWSIEKAIATPSMGHGGKREYATWKDAYKAARDGCHYDTFVKKIKKLLY